MFALRTFLVALTLCARAVVAADPYTVLGVSRNAQAAAIDAAYLRALEANAGVAPPDVREAYLTLSDPEKRRAADTQTRRELVRQYAEWRAQTRVQLVADYQLRHPNPAQVRAGYLRMLVVEREAAWNRMFADGTTPERDREARFWNEYRRNPFELWVRVLQLAMDDTDMFLAAAPTLNEAERFLEYIDMRSYFWIGGTKSKHAARQANEEELNVVPISMRVYATLLDEERLVSAEEVARAIHQWWCAAQFCTAEVRGPLRVHHWILAAAKTYAVTPESIWESVARLMRGKFDSPLAKFEELIPSLVQAVPARGLFVQLQEEVARRVRVSHRSEFAAAASEFGGAVAVLAAADPAIAAELRWAASRRGAVVAVVSEPLRCVRALAQASQKTP